MQAVGLLQTLGYTRVRYYPGGLEAWQQHGDALEATVAPASLGTQPTRGGGAGVTTRSRDALLDMLDRLSAAGLFRTWLWVILVCGALYWLIDRMAPGLREGNLAIGGGTTGFAHALYFSFVTALSIGYGDVVPVGPVRALAILEGILGLLIFGVLISKLVGRRQERLTAEIHRITFEDRLGRVRTNLHLVLTELQGIAMQCKDCEPERFVPRIESAAAVLAGELRTVHELLFRSQDVGEDVLEAILAALSGVLREMGELLVQLPDGQRSNVLRNSLRAVRSLADEICGECVPRAFAPDLKGWMDRIRELARALA